MKFIRSILVMCVSLVLEGCSVLSITQPAPHESQPIKVIFTAADVFAWGDMALGLAGNYRVPNSQVLISGPKGGAAALLKKTEGAAETLQISLTTEAQGMADAMIADEPFAKSFSRDAYSAGPTLTVSSAVIMTFETNDTDVLPYVVLKASLTGPGALGPNWSTRYIALVGPTRPLTGERSWTADGGKDLRSTLTVELQRAIRVMLLDVASPYPRDDKRLTMVEGHFPFIGERLDTVGYELTEDQQSIAFVPKLGAGVAFAGVNIMEKSSTIYRPAEKSDRRLKAANKH